MDPSPKVKRIKTWRAQYKEFVESGLKTRFPWIGSRSWWTTYGKKAMKNKEKPVFLQRDFSSAKSEESSSWIYFSYTWLQVFYQFVNLPIMGFIFFISPSFALSHPSTCRLNGWHSFLSHQHLLKTFWGSCKAEHHCSGITFTLMWLES